MAEDNKTMVVNDIELVRNETGYDWNFNPTDLSIVVGVGRLKSAIINAVYTRYGELSMESYRERGNHMFDYVRAKNSEQNLEYTREAVVLSCKSVSGVEDARVTLHTTEDGILIDEVIIMTSGGVEVSLGAI